MDFCEWLKEVLLKPSGRVKCTKIDFFWAACRGTNFEKLGSGHSRSSSYKEMSDTLWHFIQKCILWYNLFFSRLTRVELVCFPCFMIFKKYNMRYCTLYQQSSNEIKIRTRTFLEKSRTNYTNDKYSIIIPPSLNDLFYIFIHTDRRDHLNND